MPLYEYKCGDCEMCFEALRSMAEADAAIECPRCGSDEVYRQISLFSAISSEGVIAGSAGGCGSCTPSGSCATCAQKGS